MEEAMNSHKPYVVRVVSCITVLTLLLLPSLGAAAIVSLAPGYTSSIFTTLDFSTRTFAVDMGANLYATDIAEDFSGTTNIYVLNPSDGYSTRTLYTSYNTTTCCSSGVIFGAGETQLFVSEVYTGGDAGLIRELDTATLTTTAITQLPDFRPTGIGVNGSGTIYFPGRLSSDPNFGNLYRLSPSGTPEIVVSNFVATGIAIDPLGNLYASTPSTASEAVPFNNKSIYQFDAVTLTPTLIATTEQGIGEITADAFGNIYALEGGSGPTPIIHKISAVPLPAAVWLFGSGLLGLIGIARRKKA